MTRLIKTRREERDSQTEVFAKVDGESISHLADCVASLNSCTKSKELNEGVFNCNSNSDKANVRSNVHVSMEHRNYGNMDLARCEDTIKNSHPMKHSDFNFEMGDFSEKENCFADNGNLGFAF